MRAQPKFESVEQGARPRVAAGGPGTSPALALQARLAQRLDPDLDPELESYETESLAERIDGWASAFSRFSGPALLLIAVGAIIYFVL